MLYAAYGSNLNIKQMGWRCPSARVVGVGKIQNYALEFRGYLTIVPCEKEEVPVAIWDISDSDLISLDHYEGYPDLYDRVKIPVDMGNYKLFCLVYVMNKGNKRLPSNSYLDTVAQGYEDVGFDPSYLIEAIRKIRC